MQTNNGEGLRKLKQPAAAVARRLAKNTAANEAFIQQHYPDEKFLSNTAQLQSVNRYTKKLTLPENVRIAQRKQRKYQ